MALNESKHILLLDDDELEEFVKKWLAHEKASYCDFERNSGSGDRGLDAVGFRTENKYAGAWHNYQCKQLGRPLGEAEFFSELGKVFFYATEGEFCLPEKYIFVAPNGVVRNVRKYIGMPDSLKAELLNGWKLRCGEKIIENVCVLLDDKLRNAIQNYDFSAVQAWNVHKLIEQPNVRKVLSEHVDIDPGSAPSGIVPTDVSVSERPYISQLIDAYSAHCGTPFGTDTEVFCHPEFGSDLRDQRRRYHDAEAFHRHFRDSLSPQILEQFDQDIYDGVVDEYRATKGYPRLLAVMKAAAQTKVSGVFDKHSRAPNSVKQGVCHRHVNKGKLKWS